MKPTIVVSDADRLKIEQALPAAAIVRPARPRKLLIFELNLGYPGHPSIAYVNHAFTEMGRKTGAYEAVVSHDPSVFAPESLKNYDAVFFNNTVGNQFEDPAWRQSLIEFVYGGKGLLGVHGTTVASSRWPCAHEDWPEFALMIGARGANHRASDERVFVKLDSPVSAPVRECTALVGLVVHRRSHGDDVTDRTLTGACKSMLTTSSLSHTMEGGRRSGDDRSALKRQRSISRRRSDALKGVRSLQGRHNRQRPWNLLQHGKAVVRRPDQARRAPDQAIHFRIPAPLDGAEGKPLF